MKKELLNELTNPNSNENKERQKILAKDKEQLKCSIEKINEVFISEIIFRQFGNEENENLRKEFEKSFDGLITDCLTKIENL